MKFHLLRRAAALMLSAVLLAGPAIPAHAAGNTPVEDNRGWIRAKLEYTFDDGVTGLSDDIIHFTDGWTKIDDWYYYKDSVKPGDKVRFITGVDVPKDWTEKIENKKFQVTVVAEVSEAAPKDTGWDKNTEILYSQSYDLWCAGYKPDNDLVVREGKLTIDIHEYQLDENGKEIPYENDKVIVPGQSISKIAEFEIGGEPGGLEKTPVEEIIEIIKTGQNTFLIMGILGLVLMAGGGYAIYRKRGGAK